MKELNRNSKIPLYKQLKNILSNFILTVLDEGDYIPTEKEIIDKYGVSRATVRRAIDELVIDGFLVKKQGSGTYVNKKRTTQPVGKIFSWTEEMEYKNRKSKTIELDIKKIEPPKNIKKLLRLKDNEKVIKIQRIRDMDGTPTVIMINYISEPYIPNFMDEKFDQESLYKYLEEKYNLFFDKANETFSARNATTIEASLLNITEGDAVLSMRRISYLEGNRPCEVVDMIVRGDKYQYSVELVGR